MSKRKIFDEMMEGVQAMKNHREGKITLRTYNVEAAPLPKDREQFAAAFCQKQCAGFLQCCLLEVGANDFDYIVRNFL